MLHFTSKSEETVPIVPIVTKIAEKLANTTHKLQTVGKEHTLVAGTAYTPKNIADKPFSEAEGRAMLPVRKGVTMSIHSDKAMQAHHKRRLETMVNNVITGRAHKAMKK